MHQPRVLLGAESLAPGAGGISRVARLMARVLAEQRRETRLAARAITLNGRGDLGIPCTDARGSRAAFVALTALDSARATHNLYDFAGMARAHPRLGRLSRPMLMWIHGVEIWEEARPDRLRMARLADVLLCNTDYTRTRAARLHPGNELGRAQTCWLATEEDEPPQASATPAQPSVMILARLDEGGGYKGHRELIAAWPAVGAAVPGARLRIVGGGPGRAVIEDLVRRSSAREHIELRGFVPDSAMPDLWRQTSVLAMPSRGEGFGLTYIEAMRYGIPVLASVHDAAVEINLDGITGFNVDLDRPDALPQRLIELLSSPGLSRRLGAAAQERWAEHFRFSAFRRRFVPLLEAFLAR